MRKSIKVCLNKSMRETLNRRNLHAHSIESITYPLGVTTGYDVAITDKSIEKGD